MGVVFVTVAAGFLDFTFCGLRQSIVYGGLGHVQVLPVTPEARARVPADVVGWARARLRADPGVESVAARLELQGLVSAGVETLTFSGVGVEAGAESKVRAAMMLTAGAWFSGRERVPQALLGSGLATRLHVRPRDLVSVITYSDRGSIGAADVQVAGIFETGVVEYDARTLLLPIAAARLLLETPDFSSLVVTLHDAASAGAVADRLQRLLRAHAARLRVVRWDELSPVYGSVVHLYRWILDVFLTIVTVVVVLGITNTMSMAVLERVPEVGVLRALGFGAGRIVVMFLLESCMIGALGAGAGVVAGIAVCIGLSSLGIDMPPPPGHSQGYVAQVHVVPRAFVAAAAIAVAAAVVAGMGPSLRAVRREVSHVLRAT
jgi:putative ABC transport system permease protein